MRKSILLITTYLLCASASGQAITTLFERSKGQWALPLAEILSIDTTTRSCVGDWVMGASDLTLSTRCNQAVVAIQPGEVCAVIAFDQVYTIVVRSGDFFLSYTGLDKPNVQKGQVIAAGMVLGNLAREEDEKNYVLNLVLFTDNKVLNINRWFKWAADKDPCSEPDDVRRVIN